jgi:hypothetical protein
MQSKTLIAAVAFGVALSGGPMVSANWQHTRGGMTPEQIIKAPNGPASAVRSDREKEDRPYSVLGGGPMTGWQTLPPMTLEVTKSPTGWQLVQVRVGMGEGGALWRGFSLELQMLPKPEVWG